MNTIHKASYTSYILGKAMLKALDVAAHEMRVSDDKVINLIIKENQKDRLKLHQSFMSVFKVMESKLTKEDRVVVDEEVLNLVGDLWGA